MPADGGQEILHALGLEIVAPPLVAIGCGLLLLAFGRKLYWLLAALAGFALGFAFLPRLLDLEPGPLLLLLSLAAGVVGAVMVVVFQKLAVGIVGFAAAGLALLYLASILDWRQGLWILIAAVITGIAGAIVARSLFELALIVFTSIAGATLVAVALPVSGALETVLLLVLIAVGVAWQVGAGRRAASD